MTLLKQGKYFVSFSSSVEHLEEVETIANTIAKEAGFDESDSDDISIAITELFNNAVHHGNKDDINKLVRLTFIYRNKSLHVTVKDEGNGFRPESLKDPLAPENLMAESGRGIYLVRNLMDDIEYSIDKTGSEITITKHLPE